MIGDRVRDQATLPPSRRTTMSENPDQTPAPDAGGDQDAEPPGDGIAGPVHSDDPAEGPDPVQEPAPGAGTAKGSHID
jgi:hypothetical protein